MAVFLRSMSFKPLARMRQRTHPGFDPAGVAMHNPDLSRQLATDRLARMRREADLARVARDARSRTRAPARPTRLCAILSARRKRCPESGQGSLDRSGTGALAGH